MGGPGLQYEYYEETSFTTLPNFDLLTPVTTGTAADFDLNLRQRDTDFAFRFRGRLRIPSGGSYTFYTTSDDGSQLRINGNLVVDNDGLHSETTASGSLALTEGTHDIEVTFFEHTGQEVLTVEYEGPGITRTVIPPAMLTQGDAGALRLGATKISDPATIELEKWHRIVLTCEVSGSTNLDCRAYVDGVQTEIGGVPMVISVPFDGDYALPANLRLFTDNNNETEAVLVNSLSFWGCSLTSAEVAALGSPAAVGHPDIYVSNSDNSGAGSLRRAITDVRSGGLICFDLTVAGQTVGLDQGGALTIDNKVVEIDARPLSSNFIVDGRGNHRTFEIVSGSDVKLRGLTFTGGITLIGGGGAIQNDATLLIEHCLITSSSAENGGGIINEDGRSLTVIESTICNNTADAGGGVTNAGTATFLRCTISGNTAGSSGGLEAINTTFMTNCTVTQNSTTNGGGGGISTLGTLTLINCTVSDNDATDPLGFQGGGGILLDFTTTFSLENSIVAGNDSNVSGEENIGGTAFSTTYLGNNLTGGDPMLETLADFGGLSLTMKPKVGSSATAGGSPTVNTPATDQRGLPRIVELLDIGAVETSFGATTTLFGAQPSHRLRY